MPEHLRCTDCRNRTVILTTENWFDKILLDHDIMEGNEGAIIMTLEDPDIHNRDKAHADRECFYRAGLLFPPNHNDLLKIVVAYESLEDGTLQGRIVTAHAVDRVARGETAFWKRQ